MAEQATLTLCVLWEHELQAAGALLRQLHEGKDLPDDEYSRLAADAMQACTVALWNIGEGHLVMLAHDDIKKGMQPSSGDAK